jgi:glycine cleavage system aminomethyltransferase T
MVNNPPQMRISVDGAQLEVTPGENLLVALLRRDLHPTGGGCLCMGGDCPHCLATVDGVSYVRTCQSLARAGMVVERSHFGGALPPIGEPPFGGHPAGDEAAAGHAERTARHLHCDVVVIGQGGAGRAAADESRRAGREVVTLEARDGREAVGVYAGPLVVARTGEETLLVHPRHEIVVATGAAEIQPVAPGSHLAGLVTARAAAELAAAGIDLGRVVSLGELPVGVGVQAVDGELQRFEGERRVGAVVVRDRFGVERRYPCDTVCLGLGLAPRDTLYRMARELRCVRVAGDAAREGDLPACPRTGTVCPCAGVEVEDLRAAWDRGFRELELVKRATLAGTGTCQGSSCLPHVRSFLLDRGRELQPPFTARPVTRQVTIGEIAAGAWHRPTARTPLHDEHLRLGARMERSGGWWRPWTYGDPAAEYDAVRRGVSIGDVSTLGKFLVSGPDAEAFLELVYPTRVATLRPGGTRYALLLDERGYVLDDGLLCRDSQTRFTLTLTSAGSTFGELWLRDWAESGGFDVRIMNQTASLAAINVTGPRAAELLCRAGMAAADLPAFARHGRARVTGVACRIYRLSFTGELSYELHHAAADSTALWRRLLALGRDLDARPHGLETLLDLRLEKGHIVVGQDTDYDSTPRRLDHAWAVKLDKPEFIGRQALLRTDAIPLDKQLVGFEMETPAPAEGAVIESAGAYAGYVTSSADSGVLGRAVLLGWLHLRDGELPAEVSIDGRPARRVRTPFYDPEGTRARAAVSPPSAPTERSGVTLGGEAEARREAIVGAEPAGPFRVIEGTRVVAAPAALDGAAWPAGAVVLRIAADEVLALAGVTPERVADPHALVERETGFSGGWLPSDEAAEILSRTCAWEPPGERPACAQGAVAEVPVKLWLEGDRTLVLVQSALAADLEGRLRLAGLLPGGLSGSTRR